MRSFGAQAPNYKLQVESGKWQVEGLKPIANAKCRMQNAKLSGLTPNYKLQVESGKWQVEGLKPIINAECRMQNYRGLRQIIDKVVVMR